MILCAAALAFGCGDEKTDEGGELTNQTLSVSAEKMVFSVGGDVVEGENAVTVTCSSEWRLLGDKTWCTPSITKGTSGAKVTFTAAPNTATEPRTIEFTFVCGDKAVKMAVTQKQSAVLDLISGSTVELGAGVSAFTIRAVANTDLTCYIPETSNWITQQDERTRAVEGAFLRFTAAANDTYADRIGAVVLKVDGKETAVEIKQLINEAVVVEKLIYEVPITGGQITVKLQSNIEYTISIPSQYQSWITLAPSTRGLTPGQATFNIAAGTGTRVGQIIFATKAGVALTTVRVVQYSHPRVYVDVPDDDFREWLAYKDYIIATETGLKCDMTGVGVDATSLSFVNYNIVSIAGIEGFQNMTTLTCAHNRIAAIDLSKNPKLQVLSANKNEIVSINLSNSPELNKLVIYNNKLTALDVSKCPKLTYLDCEVNQALMTLYVAKGQVANFKSFYKDRHLQIIEK